MSDFPHSLIEFQSRFRDEAACVGDLFAARWPAGFVCPTCGKGKAWQLQTKAWTWECAHCGKETSVTAGTIMRHSKLPLTLWFWAAYLMATHANGISALQLQRQLGLRSYKSAWLLCAKLRRSMVAGGRSPLAGLVEVDETEIVCRGKNPSWSAPSRSRMAGPPGPHPPATGVRLLGRQPAPFLKAAKHKAVSISTCSRSGCLNFSTSRSRRRPAQAVIDAERCNGRAR